MGVPLYIAGRYLFARKSHNVINVISAISAIGMAIGTAALILILSVYNGFDGIIENNLSDLDPDILVTAAEGKYFIPEGEAFQALLEDDSIASISSVLEDNVFISYDSRQGIARAKGVDLVYDEESALAQHIVEGEKFELHHGTTPMASVGAGFAYSLGIHPRFLSPMQIYYPQRDRNISLMNPESSLNSVKIWPSSLFSISTDVDADLVVLPIEVMHELTGTENEVSALEIRLNPGTSTAKALGKISAALGPGYHVRDRIQQHPALYKMMRYEKMAIFMILIFVVIIVAFNIFGSLSMLIIEKEGDMATLRAMGATDSMVRRIFILEGWMVSLLGLAAGLVVGIALALVQQHFGIVQMPGNFLVKAYPVVLEWGDVFATTLGVAAIGLAISVLASPGKNP